MRKEPKRIVIYAKDVSLLTGRSYRQSLKMLNIVRNKLGKEKKDFITFEEFLEVFKLKSPT